MSYCRFTEGDVYVFLSSDNLLECCGCSLQERKWINDGSNSIFNGYLKAVGEIVQTTFSTTQDMIEHLNLHREKGHYIPDFCIEGLLADQEENDILMNSGDKKDEENK
jgi:hypothetical protein